MQAVQSMSDEELIRILVNEDSSQRFINAAIVELGERSKALYTAELELVA